MAEAVRKAFPDGVFTYTQENGQTHTVRKVKVVQKSTLQAVLNDGKAMADNGSMVRIDVFRTPKKYVFVPVYVKDTVAKELPNRACVAHKNYEIRIKFQKKITSYSRYIRMMLCI